MDDLLRISKRELENLLATATAIGVRRGLEYAGEMPRLISLNRAYKQFCKARVQTWIKDGRIKTTTNGNGKTSTVYLDYAKLLELDASDVVIIHKSYTGNINRLK
jgi:hypothetical protein